MLAKGQDSTPDKNNRAPWMAAVWALIILYSAFFAVLTIQKHNAFQTTAFDLGNVDQAVWNTRHGRPLAMTNIEGLTNRLGTHVEPILLPISLSYFLWSDPRTLLLLQTLIIALGAWPLYLIAKRAFEGSLKASIEQAINVKSQPSRIARRLPEITLLALPLVFVIAYLLFPALQSANQFDFHAVALAPTFFLFAFYCLETERWGWFALFSVLTMSCKEDMPLLVVMLGLYALVVRRKWVIGSITIAAAALWFALAVGVVMPAFDPGGVAPLATRYDYLGDSPLEIVRTILTQPGIVFDRLVSPESLAYLRDLLTPVAFLSVLAPQVLVLATPTLLINLLSTDPLMHQLEGFHYGAVLAPIIVVSAAHGGAWLTRRLPRFRLLPLVLMVTVLAATLLYHRGHGYTPLATSFRGTWPAVTNHHRLGERMARQIPPGASLAALPHPNPHASQREYLYMIDRVENGLPAPLNDADYVWLDVTNGWPLHPNDLKTAVDNLLTGEYGIDQAVDGWLLLRRGAPEKVLPDSFFGFARAEEPAPQYPMRIQFMLDGKPILEALGFDMLLDPQTANPRVPAAMLRFYWRALEPLPPGLRLYPFYFDDATGQILEDTTLRPMSSTVWHPPAKWRPGETIVNSTLPWDVGTDYSVGLGVVQGDDWGDINRRLPIAVESSSLVVRLFDGDTWARLMHVEDGVLVEERRVYDVPKYAHAVEADLGPIQLLGYNLDCDPPPETCALQLIWQAQERPDTSYVTFAQLLDPAGQVRAQVDAMPHNGGYPTTWWLPGEVVIDSLTLELPADAPRDVPYRLIVGLYDPVSEKRLPATGTGADFVELTVVEP